jgi:hypothetical protein
MNTAKIFSDQLDHCYAIMRLENNDHDFLVVASEEEEPCFAYDLNDNFKKISVWNDVGGTMTMIQIPGTLNFLATQKFYPGFNSKNCRIVKETFNGTDWDQSIVGDFPYVHRFDLIQHEQGLWFIGCSIANSKKNVDDWTNPGKVWVGDYNDESEEVDNLRDLDFTLTKNHGYKNMGNYSLITGVRGVYRVDYPTKESDWKLTQLVAVETSDIATADINGDGKDEYLTIEGFHGPYTRIYDSNFNTLYKSEPETPFGHAIWGGKIGSKQYFVFGYREGKQDLELINFEDNKINIQLVDNQVGPSNATVYEKDGIQYIFSANRESDEVAVYKISDSE